MKKYIFCIAILLIAISIFASCAKNTETPANETTTAATLITTEQTTFALPSEEPTYLTSIGNGANSFVFNVIDLEGNETSYLIKTDLSAVGPSLTSLGMININEANGAITDVNGINADTNKTGVKWAVYSNGENITATVNETTIKSGTVYTFKLEK